MKKIFILFALAFSTESFADLSGTWTGKASFQINQLYSNCNQEKILLDATSKYMSLTFGEVGQCFYLTRFRPTKFSLRDGRVFWGDIQIGTISSDAMILKFIGEEASTRLTISREKDVLKVSYQASYFLAGILVKYDGEFTLDP